jgi:hypothetical protein
MMRRQLVRRVGSCGLLALLSGPGLAQDPGGDKVDQLETKVENLEAKVKALESQQEQGMGEVDESFDEIDQQVFAISKSLSDVRDGNRKFLVTGYATGGFTDAEGEDSSFGAEFVPIFLWKLSDRIFLEGEIEFELEDGETHAGLEYVQMSYVVNDAMTLGFGKFLNPANPFASRLHPAWINKMPDAPLAFGARRLMSFTQTGLQVHGGVPVGSKKLTYAVYVSNGANLREGPDNYGTLDEANYTDTNNNKAIGGRVGYFPLPELEVGYSLEISKVSGSASEVGEADATVQSVDLNYTTSVGKGTLDLRGQWAFSEVDNVTYDPAGSGGFGPVTLNNERDGGYLQVAFRPSESESEVVSNLEGVVRYDQVDLPTGAPEGNDQSRVTVGMNYWTSASSVFKLAYRFDDTDSPGESADALMFQWGIGF